MPDDRAIRIAENEVRFREINDRLEGGLRRVAEPGERLGFVCECGDAACDETVTATLADYERVRADPVRFLVVPGHQIPDVEDVVAEAEGHVVVRKHRSTHAIARATDPRAQERPSGG